MENNEISRNNKKRAAKGPNQRLRQRTAFLIIIILVLGFGAAITRLGYLTLMQGSALQEDAVDQQLKDTTLSAKRGNIYDKNGNILAESASVWQVVMSPVNFKNDKQRKAAAEALSEILELDYDNVYEKTTYKSYYVVVKRKIEADKRAKILELIDKLDEDYDCSNAIQLLDDYKRYYPKNDLASCVIGFTGLDETGMEGVEYKYNDYLAGTPGRMITATDSNGNQMPFQYEQNIEAQDGNNIYLTIDETVQAICEKYMKQGIVDNKVLNRAVCIAMDVKTGAILSMVTADGYNLNDPYTLPKETQRKIDALPKKKQDAAESEALYAMWRNKAVADTYMPGSVFKMCTASMALEEGKITDNMTFYCGGSMKLENVPNPINCNNLSGHGTQTFTDAITNSCNPAFIQIGQLIGIDKFCQYYEGFGFSEKSGIDLPGEGDDSFWEKDEMKPVDLAVASFGQNFQISPIQMITACAAVANGGYVLQPYVVSKITDADGNVIKSTEKIVKRQVISKQTSDRMREILNYNTEKQGAAAGYVAGYKVGGKTGTSEKKGVTNKLSQYDEDYISSFCGFAPADDPQIAMLVFFDTPNGDAYYGSQVAAPVFINIMTEVLPYLEVKTEYTDDELEYVNMSVGDYAGLSVEEAQTSAETDGFTTTVKGEGNKVVAQIPAVSSQIAKGGNIVLYTDEASRSETVTVPSLLGLSASEVNSVASSYGLNVSFKGVSGSEAVVSIGQEIAEGTQVSPGTVIGVNFEASSTSTFND